MSVFLRVGVRVFGCLGDVPSRYVGKHVAQLRGRSLHSTQDRKAHGGRRKVQSGACSVVLGVCR